MAVDARHCFRELTWVPTEWTNLQALMLSRSNSNTISEPSTLSSCSDLRVTLGSSDSVAGRRSQRLVIRALPSWRFSASSARSSSCSSCFPPSEFGQRRENERKMRLKTTTLPISQSTLRLRSLALSLSLSLSERWVLHWVEVATKWIEGRDPVLFALMSKRKLKEFSSAQEQAGAVSRKEGMNEGLATGPLDVCGLWHQWSQMSNRPRIEAQRVTACSCGLSTEKGPASVGPCQTS